MSNPAGIRLLLLVAVISFVMVRPAFSGDESWRDEFDATCAQSDSALSFSVSELKLLIERCERLQKVIETQSETVRKVYLKRLQLCMNLYRFVLESDQRKQQKE